MIIEIFSYLNYNLDKYFIFPSDFFPQIFEKQKQNTFQNQLLSEEWDSAMRLFCQNILGEHEQELILIIFKCNLMLSKSKYQCNVFCDVDHQSQFQFHILRKLLTTLMFFCERRYFALIKYLKGCHAKERATYFHLFIYLTDT